MKRKQSHSKQRKASSSSSSSCAKKARRCLWSSNIICNHTPLCGCYPGDKNTVPSCQQQQPKKQRPLQGQLLAISTLREKASVVVVAKTTTTTMPQQQQLETAGCRGSTTTEHNIQQDQTKGQDDDNQEEEDDKEEEEWSYNTVMALGHLAGATITSQVHGRILALVATRTAVQHATQRVRRAWQRNVPVVSVAWLQRCVDTGTWQSWDTNTNDFLFLPQQQQQQQPIMSSTLLRLETEDDAATKHATWSSKLPEGNNSKKAPDLSSVLATTADALVHDLGCCCACHETDVAVEVIHCPWCTDCSASPKNKNKQTKVHNMKKRAPVVVRTRTVEK